MGHGDTDRLFHSFHRGIRFTLTLCSCYGEIMLAFELHESDCWGLGNGVIFKCCLSILCWQQAHGNKYVDMGGEDM